MGSHEEKMNLSNLSTILRRELSAYFNSSLAYIFIIVFVFLNGGLFMTQFFLYSRADMRPFFATLPYTLAVFMPAVTMRLWAEERKGNTLELLLTFPMGTETLVLGKFLAGLVFYAAALAATLTIPLMITIIGHPDTGSVLGGYVGALMLGSFFLAIGIFVSGLCRDQIVAFIVSMMICFGIHLAGTELIASSIDGWVPGFGSFLQNFIGSFQHYESFSKGVLDNRDLLYFIIGSAIFLTLNGFWLEGRLRPGAKKIFTTATVIAAGIFLMSNWLFAEIPFGRFDLTQGKIYTISPATKKILRELKAPVTAKFYVSPSDKMPTGMKAIEQDVVDKLQELSIASGGKLNFKIFHMEAANITNPQGKKQDSLEQQLRQKGIQPFQVRAIESDEVNVKLVYSSISVGYKEKADEIIPQVLPDNLHELEYQLMSKIYRMSLASNPKIALVAPFQEKQVDPEVAGLLAQLGGQIPNAYREDAYEVLPMALDYEGYEMSRIKLTDKEPIPEGTKTLLVVEPSKMNDQQRYEINRFLVGGGSLLMAVQNYDYQYQPTGGDLTILPNPKQPDVNSLLSEWGFGVEEQILIDEQSDVINLSGGSRVGPFELSVPVKIPIQILLTQSEMNQDVSITSNLSTLFYLWGTSVDIQYDKVNSQGLKVNTLLHSSENSWLMPFKMNPLGPQDFVRMPESKRGPFPLAIMAEGQFADAFSGKPVPDWPKEEKPAAEAGAEADKKEDKAVESPKPGPVTPAPGKLILTGAASMFQKNLVRGGGHLNLFMNIVDALTLGDELVTIRSKRPSDHSIGRVSAGAKIGWRFFVSIIIPILIAAIGTFRMILRRRSKQNYMKDFVLSGKS